MILVKSSCSSTLTMSFNCLLCTPKNKSLSLKQNPPSSLTVHNRTVSLLWGLLCLPLIEAQTTVITTLNEWSRRALPASRSRYQRFGWLPVRSKATRQAGLQLASTPTTPAKGEGRGGDTKSITWIECTVVVLFTTAIFRELWGVL